MKKDIALLILVLVVIAGALFYLLTKTHYKKPPREPEIVYRKPTRNNIAYYNQVYRGYANLSSCKREKVGCWTKLEKGRCFLKTDVTLKPGLYMVRVIDKTEGIKAGYQLRQYFVIFYISVFYGLNPDRIPNDYDKRDILLSWPIPLSAEEHDRILTKSGLLFHKGKRREALGSLVVKLGNFKVPHAVLFRLYDKRKIEVSANLGNHPSVFSDMRYPLIFWDICEYRLFPERKQLKK